MDEERCCVPGCRNMAQDGKPDCRGCRRHFGDLMNDEPDGEDDGADAFTHAQPKPHPSDDFETRFSVP